MKFLSPSEVLEMNRKMKEEFETTIRNQGPITPELVYSQFQRNDGRWPHKRDMTTEEMEAHQKMMKPIWDKMAKMPAVPRKKRDGAISNDTGKC
jgi:hypothetical protein